MLDEAYAVPVDTHFAEILSSLTNGLQVNGSAAAPEALRVMTVNPKPDIVSKDLNSISVAAPHHAARYARRQIVWWATIVGCAGILLAIGARVLSRTGEASFSSKSAQHSPSTSPLPIDSPSAQQSLDPSTDRSDAQLLYLQGQTFMSRRTLRSIEHSAALFRASIAKAPEFARAHAALALADALLPYFSNEAPAPLVAESTLEAGRALALDSGVSQAHVALAVLAMGQRRWKVAGHELRDAISRNDGDAFAHFFLSYLLSVQDSATESLVEAKKAFELDPLSNPISANVAAAYYVIGRNEEAELQIRRTLDLDSTYSAAHQQLGLILLAERRNEEAIAEFEKGVTLEGRTPYAGNLGLLGYAYGVSGRVQLARVILSSLDSLGRTTYVDPAARGFVWLGLADGDRTFEAFQRSLDHDESLLLDYFPSDPIFNSLRVDARFSALLARARLPIDSAPTVGRREVGNPANARQPGGERSSAF
ncbi:MAG: tetratricopeptide repeat protein [Gemmatimonadota bacterium]